VHSHRTINAEIRQLGLIQPPQDKGVPALTGAPIGHGIGMLAALLLPVSRGNSVYLIDVWDPATVLAAMLEDNVYAGAGAAYFVLTLIDHPDFTDEHRHLMRYIGLGGSAIPAPVTERLDAMEITVIRSYGSTEHPSITGCDFEDPRDKRLYTDGKAMPGVEFRLVDDQGDDVAVGEAGEIWSRGPETFLGYTVPELTAECFHDGWYATGDIGVLDADGYLAITDRLKDVIIRGGENVSPLEVEEQLLRMPGVAEVAVVAKPHPKLTEVGCAFIRLLPDTQEFDLDAVRTRLTEAGIAKQKWPEDLRFVEEFPRTPSGKVKKFELRSQLRAEPT
jgi:acyl-CoA synthetase (AMP-forming)/AMP-acid ligase II